MRLAPSILGLSVAFGLPTLAQDLDDRHLPVGPDPESTREALIVGLADPSRRAAAEHLPGGSATVSATGKDDAFSQPSGGMSGEALNLFNRGNALFRKLWIAAPSARPNSDGLGPLYNARSCQACHLRDGRGHPPEGHDDDAISMVLRLSVPSGTSAAEIEGWIATAPDPALGGQLQDFAAPGMKAEGSFMVTYAEIPVTLADGTTVSLRAPTYALGPDPLPEGLMTSPRVAPQMIGLGLLEAVPAADILALADPDDRNDDGISGRAQIVPSVEFGVPMLGRFGLKAGAPTIREQTAAALSADMGLSSPLFPDPWGDCTPAQTECRLSPHGQDIGGSPEVSAEALELLTFYARNLGVPARRGAADPLVKAGEKVFTDTGCALCHNPGFVTSFLQGQPEQSAQAIFPYTDLLLHDMGPGLADNRPEGRASGQEWRTPPLWGIGLSETVSGHSQFLHDGRARSLLEAILWHGGEAEDQRDAVATMSPEERAALLAFLASL
ncbi:MAG TPA: di-heme oxidoredictase family protein [Tabrizicola sp.]|nr:di-heme oxidoredictase family protein [Tabrizicola sp.]